MASDASKSIQEIAGPELERMAEPTDRLAGRRIVIASIMICAVLECIPRQDDGGDGVRTPNDVPADFAGQTTFGENGSTMAGMTSKLLTDPPNSRTAWRPAARLVAATKRYSSEAGAVTALDAVNLDLGAAEFTAIMGPSGSGKSTLMHCIAGLDRLSDGHAFIGDEDLATLSERQLTLLRRRQVGFVFQAFNLIPSLSAQENIGLPLALSGETPNQEVLESITDMLGLNGRLHHRPSELSGGQQQRVAVARALVSEPTIVFADEPTGNLDSASGTEILRFMRQAVDDNGQTTVMVTHDPLAAAWADRVVFIVDGRVHCDERNPDPELIFDVMKSLGR